jgi:hypothetical protein
MTLSDTFRQITMFPADGIIFAERIRGVFRPESPCVVLVLSDEQLQLPTSRVAEDLAPGLEYFLEVDIALDFAQSASTSVQPGDALDRLIHYAENDA